MYLFIYLFIYLTIYLSICISIYLSIYTSIYLSMYLYIYLSNYSLIYHLPIPGAPRNKLRLNLKFIFPQFLILSLFSYSLHPSLSYDLSLSKICLFIFLVIFLFLMSLPIKIIHALIKYDGIKSSNMHHLF